MSTDDTPTVNDRLERALDGLRDARARLADEWQSIEHGATEGLADLEGRATDALTRFAESQRERLDDAIGHPTGPSWSTRLSWLGLGLVAGAAVAHLADPDRGRARRERLAQQARARTARTGGDLAGTAQQAAGRARGAVAETVRSVTPDDVPDDPKLLRQRIRSEVFGGRDDVDDVVIRVDDPGEVALKGTMPDEESVVSLVDEVESVDGVTRVHTEVTVRA